MRACAIGVAVWFACTITGSALATENVWPDQNNIGTQDWETTPPLESIAVPAVSLSTDTTEPSPNPADIDATGPLLRQLLADLGEAPMDDAGMAVLTREVAIQVARLRGPQRIWFQRALARSWKYQPMLRAALVEFGLPEDLAWLPLIESGYSYRARSRAGALGLWQLMPDTARFHAMLVKASDDERLDPVRATLAAREYLRDRLASLGQDQILLAAATYNAGEGRIRGAMQRTGGIDFVALRATLPEETRDYVPRFLAAAIIGRDPVAHGFHVDERDDVIVLVRERRLLAELAQSLGLSLQTLRAFNDDLPTGVSRTPVTNYPLRLPAGVAQSSLVTDGTLLVWDGDPQRRRLAWRTAMVVPEFDSGEPKPTVAKSEPPRNRMNALGSRMVAKSASGGQKTGSKAKLAKRGNGTAVAKHVGKRSSRVLVQAKPAGKTAKAKKTKSTKLAKAGKRTAKS